MKINRTATATRVFSILLTLLSSNWAYSQADETFTLNLKSADIHSLIETVSLRTGKNFIVDPRVKATVTVISSEPINGDKLYEIFLSVLEVHGYAAVPAGNMVKIVPSSVGVQSAVPVLTEQPAITDELVTEVIAVGMPAQQMIDALRPLLPQTASISAEVNTNTVVITDRAANVERLIEIIRALDNAN